MERQHCSRELAPGGDAPERTRLFAGIGRQPQLDAVEPARGHRRGWRPLERHFERRAIHTESADLALRLRREGLRRRRPPLGELGGGGGELGLDLSERPLLGRQQLVVPLQPVQLRGGVVAELHHRLFGVAVLSLEARQRVEALLDRFETARLRRDAIAQSAQRKQRIVDLRLRGFEGIARRLERRVEPREVGDDAARPGQAPDRRRLFLGEQRGDLREPRREPRGMLQALPLEAKLIVLARTQSCRLELRHLEA